MKTDEEYATIGVNMTLIALREKLMGYFKSNSIPTFNLTSTVRLPSIRVEDFFGEELRGQGRLYNYQRTNYEIANPHRVKVGDTVIGQIRKEPNEISLYTRILNRSAQNQMIYEQLTDFFHKYLAGVTINTNKKAGSSDGSNDFQYYAALGREVEERYREGSAPEPRMESPFDTTNANDAYEAFVRRHTVQFNRAQGIVWESTPDGRNPFV